MPSVVSHQSINAHEREREREMECRLIKSRGIDLSWPMICLILGFHSGSFQDTPSVMFDILGAV